MRNFAYITRTLNHVVNSNINEIFLLYISQHYKAKLVLEQLLHQRLSKLLWHEYLSRLKSCNKNNTLTLTKF